MTNDLSLDSVAEEVAVWRTQKPHRGSRLPSEIAAHIQELAKKHTRSHIATGLKMSWASINKALKMQDYSQEPSVNKKRRLPSQSYSLENKLALCEEWKRSGMQLEQFCKAKGVSKSALYRWRSALAPLPNDKAKNWLLVKPTSQADSSLINETLIELILPNQAIARIKLLRTEAVTFFQELYHAIAAIR